MTLTNEQFKARVAEIFADGAPITDTKFSELSDAITQLEHPTTGGGGGDLTVKIAEKYKDLNSGLETRLQTTVTKTDTGQTLEMGVGPWYNIVLREVYGWFPKAKDLAARSNTNYTMPEEYIVSGGPTTMNYYIQEPEYKLIPTSMMAWRPWLNGTRNIYAINWNKSTTIDVYDLKKETKNTYRTDTLNGQLPAELKTEGLLDKYGNFVYSTAWDVGRLTASNGNTFTVERVNPDTGESVKCVYKFSITDHSSGVKFNEEGKFQIGQILNITGATFTEEYVDPTNQNTLKRRIIKMR